MLIDEPLGISCVFSDGGRAPFALEGLPNLLLARDLATGLVDLIHPHGTADSADGAAPAPVCRLMSEQGYTSGRQLARSSACRSRHLGGPGLSRPRDLVDARRGRMRGSGAGIAVQVVLDGHDVSSRDTDGRAVLRVP